jgi:hypothetical protein
MPTAFTLWAIPLMAEQFGYRAEAVQELMFIHAIAPARAKISPHMMDKHNKFAHRCRPAISRHN